MVLHGRPASYLTLPEEKADRIQRLGVDHVVTQRFDQEFSLIPAEQFLDQIVRPYRRSSRKTIWVGRTYRRATRRMRSTVTM